MSEIFGLIFFLLVGYWLWSKYKNGQKITDELDMQKKLQEIYGKNDD